MDDMTTRVSRSLQNLNRQSRVNGAKDARGRMTWLPAEAAFSLNPKKPLKFAVEYASGFSLSLPAASAKQDAPNLRRGKIMTPNNPNHDRLAAVDSRTCALKEISDTATALRRLVLQWKLGFIAYLIEMVYIEAENEVGRGKE